MALPRHHQDQTQGFDLATEFSRFAAELRTSVAETVAGISLKGARPVAVGITSGATTRPTTSSGAIVGFALRNRSSSTTTNVTVYLYDGADANADVLMAISLAPGESVRDWFGPAGIHIGDRGLFVQADGNFDGSIFVRGVEL